MTSSLKTVLIVEDESPLRLALKDKFTRENFRTIEAKNGEEGLAMALGQHPDLILLDILMPKMDGLEMARLLRNDAWGKKVPIIILTNAADLERIGKAMENSIYEYYIKSDINLEEVVRKVQFLLESAE